eukprot:51605-Pelagomonas_calceolata.AAC.1
MQQWSIVSFISFSNWHASCRELAGNEICKRQGHAGSENTPYINSGTGDTLAQRVVSLPHQRREPGVGLVGFWQNTAPGHQNHNECFCFQWHVWLSLCTYFTEWAWSCRASLVDLCGSIKDFKSTLGNSLCALRGSPTVCVCTNSESHQP